MLGGGEQDIGAFFFQAEDGIRDLVRSRGLGDVYKRQGLVDPVDVVVEGGLVDAATEVLHRRRPTVMVRVPVSYTHLTLPTIYSV